MNFNQIASSEVDLITSEAEKDTTQSKLDLLAQRRDQKLNALSDKTAIGGLSGLTGDAFRNQLSSIAKMDQNNLTAEDLQYALGYATANPIQKDEEGKRFKLQEDAQGNFIEDATGQNVREYLSDEWSPGRNLYIDNTTDNNMKLGLAAEDKGFLGRYTPDLKQYIPFMKGYGWAPGEKGVTPDDGAILDTTLDHKLATDLEKVVHSNIGQIKNRAIGQGPVTEEAVDQFGSGKTEYTTQNAPMWNIDYKDDGTALVEGTPLPKPAYDKGSFEEFLDKHSKPQEQEASYLGNLVDAGQSSVGTFLAGTADALVDASTRGVKEVYKELYNTDEEGANKIMKDSLTFSKDWFDKDMNFKALDKYKTQEEYGYDGSRITNYVEEFKDVIGDPEASVLSKLGVIAKAGVHFPEVMASSISEMAAASNPIGLMAIIGKEANQILEERAKIKETKDLDKSDYSIAIVAGTVYGLVNTMTKGNAGLKAFQKDVKEIAKDVDPAIWKEVSKELIGRGLEEGIEEGIQGAAELIGTKLDTTKEGEILSKESALDLGSQMALGAGAGAGMAGIGVSGKVIGKGVEVLDEKIKYKMDTQDNPDRVTKPIGLDGKFNMWDSVGSPGFKVENPKSKEVYAENAAEFAVDLFTNPDALVKYGYRGQEDKGGKNIGSVLQDATDKIADIYELDNEKSKEIAKYMLVQKLVNYTRSKSSEKGEYKITPEQQQEILKETAEFVKGNRPAEIAFLEMQKEEIKAAFQDNVDTKKADEYLTAYGLDEQTNGQILADLMTLDDEQYKNLQNAVKSMKLMGSADSVIVEDMEAISTELDKLRNEAKILGSDEGITSGNTVTPQKKRKSYQDVANEVRNIGFMTRSGFKKSVKDHARDIEVTVGVEGIPQNVQDKNIKLLKTFVDNRGIDKVKPFRVVDKAGTKVLNTVAGITNILTNKMEENAELLKIINDKLKTLDAKTQPELVEKFTAMETEMRENQNAHNKAIKALESADPAVRKQAYMKLNAGSTKLDKDVLAEMLDDSGAWDIAQNYKNIDAAEKEMEIVPSGAELRQAQVTNVALGVLDNADMAREDKQFYINNKKEVDAEIAKIKEIRGEEVKTPTTKVMTGAVLTKNEYKELRKGDTTTGPYKAPEVEPKAVLEDTPKTRKEELDEVEKTVTYIDWLDKQLKNALADRNKVKSKHKILKGLQREYLVDIAKAKRDLHGVRNEMYGIAKLKDKVEKAGESTYVRAMNKFKGGLKQLANIIRALKGAITKYLKKIVALKDAENITAEELGELELQMRALGKKIGLIEKAKKQAKIDEARVVRAGMEEMLGDLVKPNNSTDNSLSALISKGAETAEIMKLMPNIISKNENGVKMVEDAVESLQEFAIMRIAPGQETYPNNWFTSQKPSENGYVNPIRDFTLGDKGVSFENLWKLEPEKEKDPEYKKYKNEIRSHVKNAMNIASVVVLKDMIDVRLNNSEQMRDTVDDGFAPVWNEIGAENASAQKVKIGKEIKAGKYVPEAVFRENAGRFMMNQLELQLSPDLTMQERADLQTALGVIVVNNLLPAGIITLENGEEVSVHDTRKDGGKPIKNTIRRGVVTIEKDTAVYKDINKETDKESDTAVRVINLEELQKDYISEVSSMATVFEFAAAKEDGQISLKPIVKKDDATIKNSDVPLAQGIKDYLNREGSRPWKFIGLDEKVAKAKEEAAKIVEAKKAEGVKNFKYSYVDWFKESILGTENELIAKTATMNMDSEIAKYRAEELIIERMLMAHELVGDNTEFYIGWDYTVSGRSMMSGKLINPQSSGISRFLVAAEDMITKIDTATIEQKSIDHLELAVAQALDVGIDKTSAENGLAELHKKFVQIVKTDEGLKLEWGNNSKLKKLVEDPEFNIGNVRKLDEELAEVMDVDPSAATLEAGSKTILHLVQAVELLREIEAGKTKIETNLALEADGITNGMAIVLMQMGWSEFTQNLLKKAGVYAKDDEFQNHGDYKDAGNTDIYESPIKKIEDALGEDLTTQIDNLIGGKWRNFMKNPVMTFIYGAGMKNITKSVAESLIIGNSYIGGALALGKIDALLKFAEVDGIEPEYKKYEKDSDGKLVLSNLTKDELAEMTDKEKAKYAYLTDWQISTLTRAINEKISGPFTDGFTETFNEIIEFRKALKTVEQVNYTIFKMKFNEKVAELSKDKLGELTFAELGKIKSEMMEEGTYYSTDSAIDGGSIDYWKTGKSDTEQDRISVTINTNDFQSANGGYSRDYNKIIKELEANIGAIGVTTIHAVDGTIMIEGHIDAVLNVYDAVMMGADFKKNEAQIQNMNKAFYDVNTRHSVLGKAVEKMEHMLEVLGDGKMTPELSVSTMRDLKRIHELGKDDGLDTVAEDMMRILDKIDAQRRALVDAELTINQYAAANDVEGVDSNTHEVDKSGRYAVYGDNTDKAGIKAGLDWLVKNAEEIAEKEEVKAESATIPAKQAKSEIATTHLKDRVKTEKAAADKLIEEGCANGL